MRKFILYLILILITSFGCSKNSLEESNGIVKDMTGLDGCSIMIELDSGERLEIVSLPANTSLLVGRRVFVKYKPVDRMSICMAGPTVEIISLQYL